jgi:tetratricopeptide (TPR) repeat protein
MIPRIVAAVAVAVAAIMAPPVARAQILPPASGASMEGWRAAEPQGPASILDPQKDPHARIAHEVFAKVQAAADKRPGPAPRLLVLDAVGAPWARSLADGTTLLTVGAVKVCLDRATPEVGAARLAFVIGHEISHQVNGDFWHYFFYQAARPADDISPEEKEALARAVAIAHESDSVRAKELKADQYGALYASQAGYDIRLVIDTDAHFFRAWSAATTPALLAGLPLASSHPSVEERRAAVEAALQAVAAKIDRFREGVAAYRQGSWTLAKTAFEDFLAAYQSREAYNNLGLVYYRMAAEEKLAYTPYPPPPVVSLEIDPETRAVTTTPKADRLFMNRLNGGETPGRFARYVRASEDYLKQAIERDASYAEARNNLACLYNLTGRPSLAVGELDRALSVAGETGADAVTMARYRNNRGAAYLALGESLGVDLSAKAVADLTQAVALRPAYPEALFNLARLTRNRGDETAYKKWRAKLAQTADGAELLERLAD